MKPNDFYPFVAVTLCARCLQPVDTDVAVGVWADGKPIGMAHAWECGE